MTIGIILGFLLITLTAVAGFASYYFFNGAFNLKGRRSTSTGERKNPVYGYILASLCAVFGLSFLVVPFSIRTVQAGEVAVVKHLGSAEKIRTAGTYFDLWVTETYDTYDARVQNLNITTMAYSKDAQTMDIVMTVQFQIDSTKAIEIANNYGTLETLSNRIESVTIEKTKSVLSSYSAMTIIETRESISPQVEQTVKDAIDSNYFVQINTVVLTNIDFSDAFEKTVEDKMIAEQEKLKAQYEKETAIVNAEKELEVAKLQAEAKIASAEGDAKAQILAAEAEAQSIKAKSIEIARALGFNILQTEIVEDGATRIIYDIDFTDKSTDEVLLITEYLKYVEYLDKWDGKLPSVMVGDENAQIIVPAPTE